MTPPADTLEPPPAAVAPAMPDMPPETLALIESLKPQNMESDIKPTIPYGTPTPPVEAPPVDQTNPAPVTPPTPPRTDNQPVNAGILRKQRDEANQKVKTLEEELATLRSKPATVDNKEEIEQIKQELEQERKAKAELSERVFRTSAKDSPQWQEKAALIGEATKEITSILKLPELTDLGLKFSADDLSDPETLNEVLAALNDGRKFAQIDTLRQALNAKNVWSRELTQLEQESAAKAQQWQTQREQTVRQTLKKTDDLLASANPYLHPGTEEFKTLPAETQKVVTEARNAAQQQALEAFKLSPEEQVSHLYNSNLGRILHAQENAALNATVQNLIKERDELTQRLKSYEKHTSRPVDTGNGAQGGGVLSPEEMAKRLRPSMMK